jgi:alkylation response protein AidB-like acyl-CoA dehydrogenase
MTFDLSEEHRELRERARAYAATLQALAGEIDRTATVPDDVAREVTALRPEDALGLVVVVEELAASSPAVALLAAGGGSEAWDLSGLRGARQLPATPRSHLALAAAALGVGRAALDACLAELKRSATVPAADVERPHWVVADCATELEAARMLTYKAAQTDTESDVALARVAASHAADRFVTVALRVSGPEALQRGSLLERLSRDVRALALVLGTEEQLRATAADGLLPA